MSYTTLVIMQSDIGSLLHKVSTRLDKVSDQVLLERLGIGLSQFRVLLYLLADDGARQNLIAENLSQSEASISRQVTILENQGLAVVRRSSTTRRVRLIFLTQKGALTAEKAVNILNDYHAPLFDLLGEKQQERLLDTLSVMNDYIQDK